MSKKSKKKESAGAVRDGGVFECAECGSERIETHMEDYSFSYGHGASRVDLSAKVPIRTCQNCGFTYRDSVADAICHDTICEHLKVMKPSQIKGLRKMHHLTQAELAEITGLGEATISRWERGILIQNQACDRYLYLLGYVDNLNRLRGRREIQAPLETATRGASSETGLTRQVPAGFPAFGCRVACSI